MTTTELRKSGNLDQAYTQARQALEENPCDDTRKDMFWVVNDMLRQPKSIRNDTSEALLYIMKEMYSGIAAKDNVLTESYAWQIVRLMTENIEAWDDMKCRNTLAEYIRLSVARPSLLHSRILEIACKMAVKFPSFHFVPFLRLWDFSNMRQEDRQRQAGKDGKTFPSVLERTAKAYAYSKLFHPEETPDQDIEEELIGVLSAKGHYTTTPMIATKIFDADVKGKTIKFVKLIAADGTEATCEIHVLTSFARLRWSDIPDMMFRVLLKKSSPAETASEDTEREKVTIIAALPVTDQDTINSCDGWQTQTGYVEHIDAQHHHIHIFDAQSRHFVAANCRYTIPVGSYVQFTPIIPKHDKFKSAIIRAVYKAEEGPAAFGLRTVVITYVDEEKGYVAWQLTGTSSDGKGVIKPIVEAGTTEPSYTQGYISRQTIDALGKAMPKKNDRLSIVVFLKRGKDGTKRPHVVDYFQ